VSTHLHSLPEVYQSSWIEMKPNLAMRYEVDHAAGSATLYFGFRDDYVITMTRGDLRRLLDLGAAATGELAAPPAEDRSATSARLR
jgi:hypothetical protein